MTSDNTTEPSSSVLGPSFSCACPHCGTLEHDCWEDYFTYPTWSFCENKCLSCGTFFKIFANGPAVQSDGSTLSKEEEKPF